MALNNTYKAVRIIGKGYDLYYSVWCNNEHELYDIDVCFVFFLVSFSIVQAELSSCWVTTHGVIKKEKKKPKKNQEIF